MTEKMPKPAMRKVLSEAMASINPQVEKCLATAGPDYLKVRAAEAFASGEHKLALVLVAWGLVEIPDESND